MPERPRLAGSSRRGQSWAKSLAVPQNRSIAGCEAVTADAAEAVRIDRGGRSVPAEESLRPDPAAGFHADGRPTVGPSPRLARTNARRECERAAPSPIRTEG